MRKLLVFICISFIACKDASSLSEQEQLLMNTITSEVFAEKFSICDKIVHELFIYNKIKAFKNKTFSVENYCEKTLNFLQIDFEYDINYPYTEYVGVLFYKYKHTVAKTEFTFIQLETNRVVKFVYDANQELMSVSLNKIY
ncbi:hypothetical protein [uncultured Kordia sp.]|uniref:hypothetical protein n=1 Tax=uncultured Kordia sp. TaxID=507699 RepID=UPI00261A5C52|nr:hypothetical protein [uncultured Kordia sp.]